MNTESLYWCYAEEPKNDSIIIEHTLRYSDVEAIKLTIDKYGVDECIKVWTKTLIPDIRMEKLNYFLAKFIFKISSDDNYIKKYLDQNRKSRKDRINFVNLCIARSGRCLGP